MDRDLFDFFTTGQSVEHFCFASYILGMVEVSEFLGSPQVDEIFLFPKEVLAQKRVLMVIDQSVISYNGAPDQMILGSLWTFALFRGFDRHAVPRGFAALLAAMTTAFCFWTAGPSETYTSRSGRVAVRNGDGEGAEATSQTLGRNSVERKGRAT